MLFKKLFKKLTKFLPFDGEFKLFKDFDDLKYFKSKEGKGFYGQQGNLYEGRKFGIVNESSKRKDPTVPF